MIEFITKHKWPLGVFIFILILWGLTPILLPLVMNSCNDYSKLGQIGDMFGVVNALFSGLTIAGLVYTIILQNQEIDASHKDAKAQRKSTAYRRYEDNFYKLIDLHLFHYEHLENSFEHFEKYNIAPINSFSVSSLPQGYREHFEQQNVIKNFNSYLLTFQFIVNTILRKKRESTRKKYFQLYFAQLHINEKRMLLYHFNFGSTKPTGWDELKKYLFIGLSRDHLVIKHYPFDGLPDL